MTLLQQFWAWIKAKGGVLHCLVVVYAAGTLWFHSSPAFHTVCAQLWAKTPSVLQSGLEAIIQILALYGVGSGVKVLGTHVAKRLDARKGVA